MTDLVHILHGFGSLGSVLLTFKIKSLNEPRYITNTYLLSFVSPRFINLTAQSHHIHSTLYHAGCVSGTWAIKLMYIYVYVYTKGWFTVLQNNNITVP